MSEKNPFISLRESLPPPESVDEIRKLITITSREDIPVLCIDQKTWKKRFMSFTALYNNNSCFWLQGGSMEYFLQMNDLAKIKEKIALNADYREPAKNQQKEETVKRSVEQGYGISYEAIVAMSEAEQIQQIDAGKNRLDGLIAQKTRDSKIVTKVMVDATQDTAFVNHSIMMNAISLPDSEAKKATQDMVDSTGNMVRSSIQLVSEEIFNNAMMNALVKKSNGTIIHHITRVYLNGIGFLSYYNKIVSTSSAIAKIRISFASKYHDFYRSLLPHLDPDDITLERVFHKGMRAIPFDFFFDWAVGFLLHDIGKAAAVEYHERKAAHNRQIMAEHVKRGYTAIMNKTNYPQGVGLIVGYHHEYYGDSTGYGYFRAGLQQHKKTNPDVKQNYYISYEPEPVMNFQTLAYFPAKVLEILDIFDSVTDPNRKYRKALSREEALEMMQDEFIKKSKKIDPILFDIFTQFQREHLNTQAA